MSQFPLHDRTRVLAILASALLSAPALAAEFMVTNTSDSGAGSLRQAILDANTNAGADVISFSIGSAAQTISLATQLPGITQTVSIDGTTQPGFAGTPLVEVVGNGGFYGLYTDAANGVILTVQGLAMHGFLADLFGAPAAGTTELRAYGNTFCTNAAGTASQQDTGDGVHSNASRIVVGGPSPAQRNVISGCKNSAIVVNDAADIRNNRIGTNAAGTAAVPNGVFGNNAAISVTNATAAVTIVGNLISGNQAYGIAVFNASSGPHFGALEIKGNLIGTDATGTQPLPNGFAVPQFAQFGGGILVGSNAGPPTPLVVGGFGAGEANLIAFNHGSGISASFDEEGSSFDSRGNSVHGNTFGGATDIDVGNFGPTPNDPGDGDVGSNKRQNTPVIVLAGENEAGTQGSIKYVVDSLPANAAYPLRIDFYVGLDDSGAGAWFAQDSYASGVAQQERTYTFALGPGQKAFPVVATATDANGHTSELSGIYATLFADGFE